MASKTGFTSPGDLGLCASDWVEEDVRARPKGVYDTQLVRRQIVITIRFKHFRR